MAKKRNKMRNPNLGTCSKCKETFVHIHERADKIYQACITGEQLMSDKGRSWMKKKKCPDCSPAYMDRRMDCVQYLGWRSG